MLSPASLPRSLGGHQTIIGHFSPARKACRRDNMVHIDLRHPYMYDDEGNTPIRREKHHLQPARAQLSSALEHAI